MEFRTIGVVGAGVMGRGVAQNLAQTGHRVVLVDIDPAALCGAEAEIRRGLRFQRLFRKDETKDAATRQAAGADDAAVLDRILFTTKDEVLAESDFVIENATEDWTVKEAVYRRIDTLCRPEVVFAANTSAITITRIAAATGRPDRVIGMHFMNPVPLKPVVEVIRGYHSSEETVAHARAFLAGMGKEAVVVEDSPGFVSNRVLMLAVNEAAYLVHEGVAPAVDVDRIFTSCFGHKMGMLETADLIGLDTVLRSIEVLSESFRDSKYRPCPLLRKMVDAGLLGRKSGRGFYDYSM